MTASNAPVRTRLVPGLCSVTMRAHPPDEVVALAWSGGLEVIEWGGDVHVPVGDLRRAREVGARTEDAGLAVCSYGSYYGRGPEQLEFAAVLETALALGAPRIRAWAGTRGSDALDAVERGRVVADLHAAAELAKAAGIELAVEFHPNTLTDTLSSTLALLADVGAGLATYWQPPVGESDTDALAGLRAVLAHVVTVHVFSWWPARERLALSARAELWRAVCDRLVAGSTRDVMPMLLEFVPDDDPAAVLRDASTLCDLIGLTETGRRRGDRTPRQ
jgi:hypothetical protein